MENGKCCGSNVCTWQSQAPSGTAKFTGVDGCEALARTIFGLQAIAAVPAVAAPTMNSRRVNMRDSPGYFQRKYSSNLTQVEACATRNAI
jgi:hypothetical protein